MDRHVDVVEAREGPDYRGQTLASARQAIPPTLRWAGAITVLAAIVNEIIPPPTTTTFFTVMVAIGTGLYWLGVGLRDPRVPPIAIPWAVTCVAVLFHCALLLMYINRPVGWDFVYIAILITAFAPLTFGWSRFVVGGSVMFATTIVALEVSNTPYVIDWVVGVISAFAVGAMLLQLRLQLVREIADTEFAREQLVQSDALTGLLNRRGLHSRLETLWAGAQRRGESVNVAFIDVVGLKEANDRFGHAFGDRIIAEVALAVRESVRREDLVARWGGDEFVVVAKGEVAAPGELHGRIAATLRARDAVFEGHWHGDVTVGAASCAPEDVGFEELLHLADQDMYAQRVAIRGRTAGDPQNA